MYTKRSCCTLRILRAIGLYTPAGELILDPETGLQAPPTLFLFFSLFLVLVMLLLDLRSAKAFSFHNRSSPNFA